MTALIKRKKSGQVRIGIAHQGFMIVGQRKVYFRKSLQAMHLFYIK